MKFSHLAHKDSDPLLQCPLREPAQTFNAWLIALLAALAAAACAPDSSPRLGPVDRFFNAQGCVIGQVLRGDMSEGVLNLSGTPFIEFTRVGETSVRASLVAVNGTSLIGSELRTVFPAVNLSVREELGVLKVHRADEAKSQILMTCDAPDKPWWYGLVGLFS